MPKYKATIYTVGSPKKMTVVVEAADFNHALKLIKAGPAFRRFGTRPKKYNP